MIDKKTIGEDSIMGLLSNILGKAIGDAAADKLGKVITEAVSAAEKAAAKACSPSAAIPSSFERRTFKPLSSLSLHRPLTCPYTPKGRSESSDLPLSEPLSQPFAGDPPRNRTVNLLIKSQLLCQLS